MAERKAGPVKPPVIDLTAREATDSAASETEDTTTPAAAAGPSQRPSAESDTRDDTYDPPPPPQRPKATLAMPWSAISISAVVGAVLGSALTYGLANWIPLPDKRPEIADPAAALATLTSRNETMESRLAAVETGTRNTQVSLDATLSQFDQLGTELRQSVADVRNAIPAAQPVDIAPVQQQLQTLEDRVAAMGAGASSADAAALAQNLATIEQSLGALTTRLDTVETGAKTDATALAALRSDLDQAKASIAAQSQTLGGTEIGPAVRLPLLVSGLESAIANGRPYAAELKNLTALLPNLQVPAPVASAAETGLMRPDALAERLSAAVPDILAGRAAVPTGDWGRDALEWAKALLALRPAAEIEGDTPEAVVSRLEGAVRRHDFTTAATLLAQLPEPMQAAAGELGAAIASHAAADAFLTGLRTQALDTAAVNAN
ncbi:MAG TPA: hypothetical protein PK286_15005 [Devosia sp.]|nr:hypothetical protein [Devosia sp.]